MSTVGRIVRKSQTSLFWCMRGLPKAKREAIYTLFAFIKHIDSIVESPMPEAEKLDLLEAWKIELSNIYDKKVPQTKIGRKICKNCMRYKIKKEDFAPILEAALLDFPNPLQAPTREVFEAYCNGVAIMPLYITLAIMGDLKEAAMRTLAYNFGMAVELTTILRNIKDDALNDHLYIPKDMLEAAQIYSTNPMAVVTDKNLTHVREKLGLQAHACFLKTYKMISATNKKNIRPLKFIFHIYKRYFDIMFLRGWEIMSPKPQIGRRDKIAIVLKTIFNYI